MTEPSRPDRAGQRGSALVLALLLAAGLVVLGATFLVLSYNNRRIAATRADTARAFHLADAGIERAIAELPNQEFDTLLAAGGTLFDGQSLGGGDGVYTVTVSNNIGPEFPTGAVAADAGGEDHDTDGMLVVNSVGRFEDTERVVRVIVEQGDQRFKYTAYGLAKLKASNSLIYGMAGTNGDMTFSGSAPRVVGDAQAVGAISDPNSYVTGTLTEGAAPEAYPTMACPALPYGPTPTCPAPPCAGISFNAGTGKIAINGPTIFDSGTYFFSELSKSGGDDIIVPVGANVQIYISDKLQMSGGGFVNQNGTAKTLQLWGCGATTSDWTVTGPQDVWFTLYAPTHKVKFTGDGDKHGSFIGKEWENSGPGDAMYDPTLTPALALVQGSWTEAW